MEEENELLGASGRVRNRIQFPTEFSYYVPPCCTVRGTHSFHQKKSLCFQGTFNLSGESEPMGKIMQEKPGK